MTNTAEIRIWHIHVKTVGECYRCRCPYPCDAIQLCDALDEARAYVKRAQKAIDDDRVERIDSYKKATEQAAEIERLLIEVETLASEAAHEQETP